MAGGRIPLRCTGMEPEFSSQDQLCVLNAGIGKPASS
ncbi:sensory rhodopsin transducer [Desulfocurvibacter africanus]